MYVGEGGGGMVVKYNIKLNLYTNITLTSKLLDNLFSKYSKMSFASTF